MMTTTMVFLLLGGNLGDRAKTLSEALAGIGQQIGKITAQSLVYETAAWGVTDQPAFFNQVVQVQTPLSPERLLEEIHRIEAVAGRVRHDKWQARTLDIDVLFYGDEMIRSASLTVPHPELQNRRFTLVPLVQVAPQFVHPGLKKTMQELLEECTDTLEVRAVTGADWFKNDSE